jgi:hypothetical protein
MSPTPRPRIGPRSAPDRPRIGPLPSGGLLSGNGFGSSGRRVLRRAGSLPLRGTRAASPPGRGRGRGPGSCRAGVGVAAWSVSGLPSGENRRGNGRGSFRAAVASWDSGIGGPTASWTAFGRLSYSGATKRRHRSATKEPGRERPNDLERVDFLPGGMAPRRD